MTQEITAERRFEFPLMPTVTVRPTWSGVIVRPESFEGDDAYGLAMGSNGTGPACRRALVEGLLYGCSPIEWRQSSIEWRQSSGKPATGINLVPASRDPAEWISPWTGETSP